MRTYWDYSVIERGEMSEETVKELLKMELMVKGVVEVKMPTLKSVEEIELRKEQYYEVGGKYFKTMDQAIRFLELCPMKEEYDYEVGYDVKFAKPVNDNISPVMMYVEEDIMRHKFLLSKNKEAKDWNQKAKNEYEAGLKVMGAALNGVWNDWYECRGKCERYKKIIETRNEYVGMTGNDTNLAEEFLLKIYKIDEIEEAKVWGSFRNGEVRDN